MTECAIDTYVGQGGMWVLCSVKHECMTGQ